MFSIIDFLIKASHREHSIVVRTVATILGAALFIAGIPAFSFWAGRGFLSEPVLPSQLATILSGILFILGIPWVTWAVYWQLVKGKGTPVPIVPTKYFLQNGPYRFMRNPMMGGFFLYLLGWAFWWNQLGPLLVAVGMEILLVLWIKFIEEPELAARFGNAYLEYKKETPFMIPKLR